MYSFKNICVKIWIFSIADKVDICLYLLFVVIL